MKALHNPIFKTDKRNSFCLKDSKCFSLGLWSGDVVFYKLLKNNQRKLKDGIYIFKYKNLIFCRFLSFDSYTKYVHVYSFEFIIPELLYSFKLSEAEIIGKINGFSMFGGRV